MGRFDNLSIHDKCLPKELRGHNHGWQTKSLECYQKSFLIANDGGLYKYEGNGIVSAKKVTQYTSITAYNEVNGRWVEIYYSVINGYVVKWLIDKQ